MAKRQPNNGSQIGIFGVLFTLTLVNFLKDEGVLNTPLTRAVALATTMSALSYWGLMIVRDYAFVPMFILPAVLIGRMSPVDDLRETFVQGSRHTCSTERVQIPTETDGVVLDGLIMKHKNVEHKRWIIWFNPNGVIFEHITEFVRKYSSAMSANALVFNFRGVGKSTGYPHLAEDLHEDGLCTLKFLLEKYNVNEADVLLHGHSMGGGVVSSMFPKDAKNNFKIVNDRSFRSLADVATTMVRNGLGRTMGMLLAMFIAGVVTQSTFAVSESYHQRILPFTGTFSTMLFGFAFGSTESMTSLVAPVLQFMGWELDAVKNFNPKQSMVVFHQADGIINYEGSSVHQKLTTNKINFTSFELKNEGQPQENHMYTFDKNETEFRSVVDAIKTFWNARYLS